MDSEETSTGSVELPELTRWVTTEVRALTSRLVSARAQELIRHLDAARRAVEAAATPLDDDMNAAAPDDLETQLLRQRVSSQGIVQAIRKQLADRDATIRRLTSEAAALRSDVESAARQMEELRAQSANPPMNVARITEEFETTIDELRREHIEAVSEQAAAMTSLPLDALLSVFNALKRAETTGEVLDQVVDGLSREFARVALFEAHGAQLEGKRQIGFDPAADVSRVRIPVAGDSFLARAMTSGRIDAYFPAMQHGDDRVSLPFDGTPGCAMAIPFIVRGRAVAVIYADDSDAPEFASGAPHTRAKFAELLHQHGLLVLLSVGLDEQTATDLQSFASLLAEEIEYTHAFDVQEGTNALERQQNLRQKIEQSRRMFTERSTHEGVPGSPLLEEHLLGAADVRRDTSFGRDLAAILPASRTAKASILTMRR